MIREFLHDEAGATAIEYGILAALITVVIVGAVTTLGTNLEAQYEAVADAIGGGGGNEEGGD